MWDYVQEGVSMVEVPNLEGYVRSVRARKTIENVLRAVEIFNNDESNPFVIKKVGVGGSVWRKNNPEDVDILIFFEEKEDMRKELENLEKHMEELRERKRLSALLFLINNFSGGKNKMMKFIDVYRTVLERNFKFKDIWLKWLRYQDSNVFHLYADYLGLIINREIYVKRRLREILRNSKIMRVSLMIYSIDRDCLLRKIPYLVIWENGKAKSITEDMVHRQLQREWSQLWKVIESLKRIITSDDTIEVELPHSDYDALLSVYFGEWLVTPESRTSKAVRKFVDEHLKEAHRIRESSLYLPDRIARLREILKDLRVLGGILNKMPPRKRIKNRNDFNEYILRNYRRVARKKDLEKIVNKFDFGVILDDLEIANM